MVEVAGRFELEGGVLDVEVAAHARLELVEEPGGMAAQETGLLHNDMSGQGRRYPGARGLTPVVFPAIPTRALSGSTSYDFESAHTRRSPLLSAYRCENWTARD